MARMLARSSDFAPGALLRPSSGVSHGPDDCSCDDCETMDIIHQFKRLYENKLQQIDREGGGDCLKMKIDVQRKWIEDLTEQTEMMARIIKELEQEATERVQMLEGKLQFSAQTMNKVMKRYRSFDFTLNSDEPFQKVPYLENDIKNLIEFIRRIRVDRRWSIDGLHFYDVSYNDLFGQEHKNTSCPADSRTLNMNTAYDTLNYRNLQKGMVNEKKSCTPLNCPNLNVESPIADTNYSKLQQNPAVNNIKCCTQSNCPNLNLRKVCDLSNCPNLQNYVESEYNICTPGNCPPLNVQKPDILDYPKLHDTELKQSQKGLESNNNRNSFSPLEDLNYLSHIEELTRQLKGKQDEFEMLKQSMLEMRNALTEEVACKHDTIMQFKKDIQQLEERCVQADKQTAFKDDIIKELRKELKQFKQQKNSRCDGQFSGHSIEINPFENFQRELDNHCTENYSSDHFRTARTNLPKEEDAFENLNSTMKSMQPDRIDAFNRSGRESSSSDDPHSFLKPNRTIVNPKDSFCNSGIQNSIKLSERQIDIEIKRKDAEIDNLMQKKMLEIDELECRCSQLEDALMDSQGRAGNLQNAVDLYLNSINVLEATEERAKIEVEQQRMTIANLQEALVAAKHELDELRQKGQQDIQERQYLINVLSVNLLDLDKEKDTLNDDILQCVQAYKRLQDANFDLEVEHFGSLQDLAIYETRLSKYYTLLRSCEESNAMQQDTIRKLLEQNRYYEQIIDYFKEEMSSMSDQLVNLQEILKMSNQSCRKENSELVKAVVNLQTLNKRLTHQLNQTEQRFAQESQVNWMNEAKIDELQAVIDVKNRELSTYDAAMQGCKVQLSAAIAENQQLTATLEQAKNANCQLQNVVRVCKAQHRDSAVGNSEKICGYQKCIADCQRSMSAKDVELEKFKVDYNNQHKQLTRCQDELQQLQAINYSLNEKLIKLQQNNQGLHREYNKLQEHLALASQHEEELQTCRKTIIEIKQTLTNLNENELNSKFLTVDCKNGKLRQNPIKNDVCLNCNCEIELLKQILNNLQNVLIKQSTKIDEYEEKHGHLKDELKQCQGRFAELQMKLARREKELVDGRLEMGEKLKAAQTEEGRLRELCQCKKMEVGTLKQEVHHLRTTKLELSATQVEISSLKDEIKRMIEVQVALNDENARLHQQMNNVKDADDDKRAQFEQCVAEMKAVKEANMNLMRQVDELTSELHCLNCCYAKMERKHRYITESVRNLETELIETRINRDDICTESRHVVDNVSAWLEEQRRINEQVKRQSRHYCDTIERLKHEKQMLLTQTQPRTQTQKITKLQCVSTQRNYRDNSSPSLDEFETCECNLGSQGTGSPNDRDSLRGSPASFTSCSVDEWCYGDQGSDDDFIRKIETVTAEVRRSNKLWKKLPEQLTTKDIIK